MSEQPLVDKAYLLEKFPGKGGWTYAQIPEINGILMTVRDAPLQTRI